MAQGPCPTDPFVNVNITSNIIFPLTTTISLQSLRKLLTQFMIFGLSIVDLNF